MPDLGKIQLRINHSEIGVRILEQRNTSRTSNCPRNEWQPSSSRIHDQLVWALAHPSEGRSFQKDPCTRSIQQAPDSEGCKQCQSLTKSQAKFNFLSKIVWHSHHSTLKHIASTQQKMPYLTIIRSLLLLLIHCLWHAGIWIASTQVSLDLTEFCVFP